MLLNLNSLVPHYQSIILPSIPPATSIIWPVMCPETFPEERTTTARATSTGLASFFNAIVDTAFPIIPSSSPFSDFLSVRVQPGATALTLTEPNPEISFFIESKIIWIFVKKMY